MARRISRVFGNPIIGKRKNVKDGDFWDTAIKNSDTFMQYYNRLSELSMSMFEWKGLPDSVDPRFLELCLFNDGMAVFFEEEELGYLALQVMIGGRLNVYRIPINRRAYSQNGFHRDLDETNSVIIYNNLIHTNSKLDVEIFATRLSDLDRSIDVNAKAQKTPILITCDESQRLTMKNMYMQYTGNYPVIYGDSNLNPNALRVLKTDAPFTADKLYTLKTQIWNEALTYLGISNINVQKKERLITDEVTRNQGGTIANRYARLEARRQACMQIRKLFPELQDIWCDYREDYQEITDEIDTIEGEPDTEGAGGVVDEGGGVLE